MIFVTVGSALPFDRLIRLVDDAVRLGEFSDSVFGQIGDGGYEPKTFEFTRFMSKAHYDETVERASAIISHAGIGTITSALKLKKPILVLPRSPDFGELVDDHQEKTARLFAQKRHLLQFRDLHDFRQRLRELADFRPNPRQPNTRGVARSIGRFLSHLSV